MFSAKDVKDLREKTGAGMLDCKKALEACSGNMEEAIDWLREKGISKAAKKESRIAADGLCEIVMNDRKAVIVEINSETDFVAKNEEFKSFVDLVANTLLQNDVTENEEALQINIDGETLQDKLIEITAKIGEKISFRRFMSVTKKENQVFGNYLHMGGRIAALVVLDGANEEVAKDVAMHVAAMNPTCIKRDEVPSELLEREENIIKEQVKQEGKPEAIAEKMVEGRLNKFYKEICLLEQPFVKDGDINVETYVKNNGGTISTMIRFEVGEGIEKKQEDFASEVMNQING